MARFDSEIRSKTKLHPWNHSSEILSVNPEISERDSQICTHHRYTSKGKPMMLINSQHFVATLTSHSPGHVTPRYRNPLQLQGSNHIFSPKKVVGLCDKLRSQNPPKNEKTYPTKREVGKIIVPRRVYLEIDFYFDPWWRFKPVACSTSLVLGSRLHRNEFCHEVSLSRVHVSRVPCP